MSSTVDDLNTEVSTLTQAETDMEARVASDVAALQQQLNDLQAKAGTGADLGPDIAAIQAVVDRIAAFHPAPASPST